MSRSCGRRAPLQVLGETYGLTRREAELASALLDGDTLERTAERLGMALGTAKTHLGRVFAKTGTARQGELAALLLRAFAGMRSH